VAFDAAPFILPICKSSEKLLNFEVAISRLMTLARGSSSSYIALALGIVLEVKP
jgi:hypothetical protein